MKISAIKYNPPLVIFGSKSINEKYNIVDDDNIIAFDDEVSRENRIFLREHFLEQIMPYYDIHVSEPRKEEYELNALIGNLTAKPKKIDFEQVLNLPIPNIEHIDNDSYRGATLVNKPKCLETLKKAGIENVVDLCGYKNYGQQVKEAGLNYFSFDMKDISGFWENNAFLDKYDYKDKITRYLSSGEIKDSREIIEKQMDDFEKNCRPFIDNFVNFIKVMQQGKCYIGCEYGTYDTTDALFLNDVFNPKATGRNLYLLDDWLKTEKMKNLYDKLTDEDKKEMGWTAEFEKKVLSRLEEN